ncbi:MAG: SipW-dependent-type signal peptide-containing protein [Lachnospiraceae bacterium]|nr:SipW-dependent-type signal peptide-containing protein [Lachnospiraceae bacterium]
MKKKALITTVSALALVAIVGVGSTLAYFTDKDAETNVVTFGHVDIDLTEDTFSSKHPDYKITGVMPGDTKVKDPAVVAKAGSEDMYIRAKIVYVNIGDEKQGQLERGLLCKHGDGEEGEPEYIPLVESTDWIKGEGEYYYYQYKVEKSGDDQKIPFFDAVSIPAEWDNAVADRTIEIRVYAEAVQADNFDMNLVTRDSGDGEQIVKQIVGWDINEIKQYNAPKQVQPRVEDEQPAPEPIG